jgi:hypothetical protein
VLRLRLQRLLLRHLARRGQTLLRPRVVSGIVLRRTLPVRVGMWLRTAL